MSNNRTVDQILSLTPIVELESDIVERSDPNDFITGRETLLNLLATGKDALEDVVLIAKQSQHPRAYEVLTSLLKTVADLSKDLVSLQIKKSEHIEAQPTEQTINNNLFVGTTADLQAILKGLTNGNSPGNSPEE